MAKKWYVEDKDENTLYEVTADTLTYNFPANTSTTDDVKYTILFEDTTTKCNNDITYYVPKCDVPEPEPISCFADIGVNRGFNTLQNDFPTENKILDSHGNASSIIAHYNISHFNDYDIKFYLYNEDDDLPSSISLNDNLIFFNNSSRYHDNTGYHSIDFVEGDSNHILFYNSEKDFMIALNDNGGELVLSLTTTGIPSEHGIDSISLLGRFTLINDWNGGMNSCPHDFYFEIEWF